MAETTAATPIITPRQARMERMRLACKLRPAIRHIRRKNIALAHTADSLSSASRRWALRRSS